MSLLIWIISNSILAVGLAVLAKLVTRFSRTPALAHALWMLVLVKMVTPPIWNVPVELIGLKKANSKAIVIAEPLLNQSGEGSGGADAAAWVSEGQRLEVTAVESPSKRKPFLGSLSPTRAWGSIWISGSFLWFLLAGWRTWRFGKLINYAAPVPTELAATIQKIAQHMGLRRIPRAVTAEGIFPPFLWPSFKCTTIVMPTGLLNRLSEDEIKTLIAHELAHFRRRDHWLRWFELAVLGVYWWHPLVWWARSELHRVEEDSCDAWVLWAFPKSAKDYAKSLVNTLDFLAERARPIPAMACGFGKKGKMKHVKERFQMILNKKLIHHMSRRQIASVCLVAVLVLPLSGYLLEGQVIGVEENEQSINATFTPPTEPRSVEDRLAKLEEMIGNLARASGSYTPEERAAREKLDLASQEFDLSQAKRELALAEREGALEKTRTAAKLESVQSQLEEARTLHSQQLIQDSELRAKELELRIAEVEYEKSRLQAEARISELQENIKRHELMLEFLRSSTKVPKPSQAASSLLGGPSSILRITITGTAAEPQWSLNGFRVAYNELQDGIEMFGAHRDKPTMLIQADDTIAFKEIARLVNLAREVGIEEVDLAQANPTKASMRVFSLVYADAVDVLKTIEDLMPLSSAKPSTPVRITVDERTNSIIVNAPDAQMQRIETLISQMDTQKSELWRQP